MKQRTINRALSLALTLAMLLSLTPGLGLPALAEGTQPRDPDRLGSISDETFTALGFDTATAKEEADALSGQKPTRTTPFPLITYHELYLNRATDGMWYDLRERTEGSGNYDPLNKSAGMIQGKAWKGNWYAPKDPNDPSRGSIGINPVAMRSVAFDPTGTGKDQYVAEVAVGPNNTYSKNGKGKDYYPGFVLRLSDAATGAVTDVKWLGWVNFFVDDFYAGAMLSIAAGDYDGDGYDELAVYTPVVEDHDLEYRSNMLGVCIYKLVDGKLKIQNGMSLGDLDLLKGYSLSGNVYDYRTVSLATVEGVDTMADSLAVAVGVPRNGDKSSHYSSYSSIEASWLGLWNTPLVKDKNGKFINSHIRLAGGLSNQWSEYGVQDDKKKNRWETMLYPGVAAGDIDGDKVPEIVVAGYRAANDNGAGWDLDQERMLVTYFKQDENGRYSQVKQMQWIGLKEGDYNGAASLGNGLKNYDIVDPPTVRVFAERGKGYNNSVFVDGVVICLPTVSADGDQNQMQAEMERGLYNGLEKSPDTNAIPQSVGTETFRICYAAPLRALDTADGYRPATSIGRRTVMDAAVGRLDGNALGREQVVFTYGMENPTYGKLGTNLCMLDFTAKEGEEGSAPVGNKNYVKNAGYEANLQNVSFSVRYLGGAVFYSTAAVDADDDSVIQRYNTSGKAPQYFFSDPQITAVLQAAPYFQELRSEMGGEPDTSFARNAGVEAEIYGSITVAGQVGIGLDVGVSGGVGASGEVLSVEAMASYLNEFVATVGASAGSETTQTFSTKWDDIVVLTMTPYAVHYYEQWDPVSKQWKEAPATIPGTPQLTKVTVDEYDRMAAIQGWEPLRENALGGARAGDPSSYASSLPSFISADKKKGESGSINIQGNNFQTVGYTDGGATTISVSETAGVTAGAEATIGVSFGGKVKVIAVALEVENSLTFTAGTNVSTYVGTEFSATTPDLPESARGNYGFQWTFGARVMDVTAKDDSDTTALVLTYLVKNLNAPPKPPSDMEVEATGERSVTMGWTQPAGVKPISYEVSRLVDGVYFPVGTVAAVDTDERLEFTDESCAPGTNYTYAVRSTGYVSGVPRTSVYSAPLSATTLGAGGTVAIQTQPGDAKVRAGGTASFFVGLSGGADAAGAQYQWKQRQGTGSWEDVTSTLSAAKPTLTLTNVSQEMDGTQYRCEVRTISGRLFSKTATLSVGQGNTSTGLTLSGESGKADETVLSTTTGTVPRPVGVTAAYTPEEGTGEVTIYDVVAQSVVDKTDSDGNPTETHTEYYLEKDGSYYLPGTDEVTADTIQAAAEGAPVDSTSVSLALASAPQAITGSSALYQDPDFTGEPMDAGALAGEPVETRCTLPYAAATDDYLVYASGGETVYVAYPGSLSLYYLKTDDGYQQLLLVEEMTDDDGTVIAPAKFTTAAGEEFTGVTPAILTAANQAEAEREADGAVKKITFSDAITLEQCDYYEGSTAADNAYPAVASARLGGETLYFAESAETQGAFTRVYLKTTYACGSETVSTLDDFDPAALYGVSADVKMTISTLTETPVPGDAVTLTAGVRSADGSGEDVRTGAVAFRMANTSGSSVETRLVTLNSAGEAVLTWTPSQPGLYQITAAYQGGGEWAPSSSIGADYTATLASSGWLSLGGETSVTVGDSVTLAPEFFDADSASGTAADVTYTVRKDGEKLDGSLIVGDTFTPAAAGAHVITAQYGAEDGASYTAVKTITVLKRSVTVAVKDLTVTEGGWEGLLSTDKTALKPSDRTLTVMGMTNPDYNLFALTVDTRSDIENGDLSTLPAASYNVDVKGVEGTKEDPSAFDKLTQNYIFTFQRGILVCAPETVFVRFQAEAQGSVRAWFGSSEIKSGAAVAKGAEVTFTAIPPTGSVVDHWTVKVDGIVQQETYAGMSGIDITTAGELDVTVSFKAQTFKVAYASVPEGDGALSAYENDAQGAPIKSGAEVPAGAKVCFVATPEDGRTLKSWSVNGVTVQINGAVLTEKTYTIDRLDKDITVKANYDDQRSFTVTAAAIDENGVPAGLMGSVTIDGASAGHTYPSGAHLTLNASTGQGYLVAEWRSYDADGSFEVLDGNVTEYHLNNLRRDWDIRVVIAPERTYCVSFGVEGVGSVTAGALSTGEQVAAGVSITFKAVTDGTHELAWWTVNGQVQEAGGNTLALPALSSDVDVRAVFQSVPAVTYNAGPEGGTVSVEADGKSVNTGDTVPYGSEVTVTLTPASGKELTTLTVNGVDVLAGARSTDGSGASTDERAYVFPVNLRQKYEIAAAFKDIPTVTVSYSAEKGGSVSAAYTRKGTVADRFDTGSPAARDGVVTLTATPEMGHRITGWTVNGVAQGGASDTLVLPITAVMTDEQTVVALTKTLDNTIAFELLGGEGTIQAWLTGDEPAEFPSGSRLLQDESIELTVTPGGDWALDAWLVNGVVQSGETGDTFTYTNTAGGGARIAARLVREVAVTFDGKNGTVTAEADGAALESGDTVPSGTAVTFRAFPDRGYGFGGWDGSGTSNPLVLTADSDLDVTAQFRPAETCVVAFSVSNPANGTITAVKGSGEFHSGDRAAPGDTIVFAVAPESNYAVSGWSDNGAPAGSGGESYTLTVTGDHEIAAVLSPSAYTVTFGVGIEGGGTVGIDGVAASPASLPAGGAVTLTAVPEPDNMVEGWYLDGSGAALPGSRGRNTYTIDALYRDIDIMVKFIKEVAPKLTIEMPGDGAGTVKASINGGKAQAVTGVIPLAYGDRVVLTAAPQNAYSKFTGWTVGSSGGDVKDETLNLGAVTADTTVTATFLARTQVSLTVSWPGNEGSVTAKAGYGTLTELPIKNGEAVSRNPGQKVELTAAPTGSGKVAQWTVNGVEQADLSNTLTIDSLDAATEVSAAFVPQRAQVLIEEPTHGAISVMANGSPVHSGDALPIGTELTLTATADDGYVFAGWGGTVSGNTEAAAYTILESDVSDGVAISASFQVSLTVSWAGGEGSVTAKAGYGTLTELPIKNGEAVIMSPGQKVELTAAPKENGKAARWTVNGVVQTTLSSTLTIDSLDAVTVVSAAFMPQTVQVLIEEPTHGAISVTADGRPVRSGDAVTVGTELILTATTVDGYTFSGWDGTVSGKDNPATYTILESDVSAGVAISASFSYTGGGGGGGGGAVTPPANRDETVITDKQADKLMKDAIDNGSETIIIDAATPLVSLPASFLKDAGSKTSADILIATPVASIRLPNGVLGELASLGGTITVRALLEKQTGTSTLLSLDVTAGGKPVDGITGGVKVIVPYVGGNANTVALLQNADGTAAVLPKSLAQDGKMVVSLNGSAQAILKDNPKSFPDIGGHWGEEYIDFVTSHELFQGTDRGTFDPDSTMTRAMLWTVLARLEGVDASGGGMWYAAGMEWAKAAGISDGTDPGGSITREQLATMLWRIAGSPDSDRTLEDFRDADEASIYAKNALGWAVEQGILSGKGGGILDPTGSATRVQVAAMLMRFVSHL